MTAVAVAGLRPALLSQPRLPQGATSFTRVAMRALYGATNGGFVRQIEFCGEFYA